MKPVVLGKTRGSSRAWRDMPHLIGARRSSWTRTLGCCSTATRSAVFRSWSKLSRTPPPRCLLFLQVPNASKYGLQDWVQSLYHRIRKGRWHGVRGNSSSTRSRRSRHRRVQIHAICGVVHRRSHPTTARGSNLYAHRQGDRGGRGG